MRKVIDIDVNDKIIKAFYSYKTELNIDGEMFGQGGDKAKFERFISFVSKLNRLKIVKFQSLIMNGIMIERIIAALSTSS